MYHVIQSSVISKGGVFEDTMFYVLAWKPASPRKCPVFDSRTALFFDLLKICQGHEHCWSTPENLRIFERRYFFLWRSPEFCENLRLFEPRPFTRTFRVMSLVLPLAWRRSVLEKCVLGLGFFLCPRLHLWCFITKIEA